MTRLHLETKGSGTPVLLVHGLFATAAGTFAAQQPLTESHALSFVDRRGYGQSASEPDEALGWDVDADDLADLLDEIGPAHLVGHSYGAVSCLVAAGRRPERVLSVVGIEPPAFALAAGHPDADRVAAASRAVAESAPTMASDDFIREWGATVGLSRFEVAGWTEGFSPADWANADASRRDRWAGDADIPFEALAAASFPTVLAHGAWNPEQVGRKARVGAAFRAVVETIAERTGGRVASFPNATHNPQREDAAAFNALLREVWAAA